MLGAPRRCRTGSIRRVEEGFHPPIEEYLETVHSLTEEGTPVIQARIAERLGRSAPSVSEMLDRLEDEGLPVADAVITACRVRLRPILMTSLATIIGMIPMALKLGTGAEQYTPMARAIIGGLTSSVLLTVFIVPAAYLLVYRRKRSEPRP